MKNTLKLIKIINKDIKVFSKNYLKIELVKY